MNNKFLVDENLSPKTTQFLRGLGLDVTDVSEANLRGKSDDKIYKYALEKKLILITFDHEFGYFYLHRRDLEGLIIIRIHPQILETLHRIMRKFFETIKRREIIIRKSIIILEKSRFRIRRISD
ncbi:MAG TPA: DUF5615 family PIN-like protein [Candidatus Bilamarchaeaceae archaeon]|nr:DUF5615 family PIN-like protein [Candidatus Bilamarchaeaceae archaeon]